MTPGGYIEIYSVNLFSSTGDLCRALNILLIEDLCLTLFYQPPDLLQSLAEPSYVYY